jgi:hypothetical protein
VKLVLTCGRVRVEANAVSNRYQLIADVFVNGAARPWTLIGRVGLDKPEAMGYRTSKGGRMFGGWHAYQALGRRGIFALAYRANTGLPVSPELLHAPKYAWWPRRIERPANRADWIERAVIA